MAQIIDRTTSYEKRKPLRTPLRCSWFGGSRGGSPEHKHSLEKGEKIGMKKPRTVWFSWSKLKKKSFPSRTVPVDGSTKGKVHPQKGCIFPIKSSKKLHKDKTLGSVTEKIVHNKPNKTKYDNVQEIIIENTKSMNHLDSMEKATCRKDLSSSISKCKSQNSISNPSSPEDKFEDSRGKVALAHSVSMPPPMRKKTVNISGGDSKVNIEEKTSQRKTDGSRFDQFVGLSIIMVTLILMVFCGKICAILCTSAWFYFYPLIRGKNEPKLVGQENDPNSSNKHDFNSHEYKKKVVLEGFLERNHRIHEWYV